MPLKPVKQREFLETISWVLKHNHFITHSSKFDCVAYPKFITMILFEMMILVPAHKSHNKPKFITWISFFIFRSINCFTMINPVIIVFIKN